MITKPLTTLAILFASTAILAACDKANTPGGAEYAANDSSANTTAASGALPPPLPAPSQPLPPAPAASYAAPWQSARAQADRIRRQTKAYRQDVFAYDDGPADAWRDGDDIVRVVDPRGRTFYYRPGEPDPYWATWDGRSYAYEGGRPTAVYYSDGRAEAVEGGLVAIALTALTEGRNLHQRAQGPHQAWGPAPGAVPLGAVYDQGRSDQYAADRARYDRARNAQQQAQAAADQAREQEVQAGSDQAARARFDAERRMQLQRAADAQRQQVALYRAQNQAATRAPAQAATQAPSQAPAQPAPGRADPSRSGLGHPAAGLGQPPQAQPAAVQQPSAYGSHAQGRARPVVVPLGATPMQAGQSPPPVRDRREGQPRTETLHTPQAVQQQQLATPHAATAVTPRPVVAPQALPAARPPVAAVTPVPVAHAAVAPHQQVVQQQVVQVTHAPAAPHPPVTPPHPAVATPPAAHPGPAHTPPAGAPPAGHAHGEHDDEHH